MPNNHRKTDRRHEQILHRWNLQRPVITCKDVQPHYQENVKEIKKCKAKSQMKYYFLSNSLAKNYNKYGATDNEDIN